MLGYPESKADLIYPNSVLYRLDEWGMGKKRSFSKYMEMVGIDPLQKKITTNKWCHEGVWPAQAEQYKLLNKKKSTKSL